MTSRDDGARPSASAALVSIHDLMPETMPAVRRTLAQLERIGDGPVTLLVVPGLSWTRDDIAALRRLQRDGHALAGHGWLHRIERFGGPYHRLHGWTLSRRVAEHLALDADGILALINRCYAWFADHDMDAPDLYVPPAWAMGAVAIERVLDACPFRLYETFTGVIDIATRRVHRIPLLGYEADTALRAPLLRAWNGLNRRHTRRTGLVRIGIHPRDPELRLAGDLTDDLRRYRRWQRYRSPIDPGQARAGMSVIPH
ncbi:MAG: polysaccharide deacetylase family protein [Thiohalocapsa sp.]|jgi:predicted deacetylase